MMNVRTDAFGDYARYYDLFYGDKPYGEEARFVCGLLDRFGRGGRNAIDFGCGTGRHAGEMAALGFTVTGVDASSGMIAVAQARRESLDEHVRNRTRFLHADMRTLQLPEQFDAATALFHVISYQTTNQDLKASFRTVSRHLRQGGILVFDFWFGPAVLQDPPAVRVRRRADDVIRVTRIAEPLHDAVRNVYHVDFEIQITGERGNAVKVLSERHSMRYLFLPELEGFLDEAGMDLVQSGQWGSESPLTAASWYGWAAARKR